MLYVVVVIKVLLALLLFPEYFFHNCHQHLNHLHNKEAEQDVARA
jgi:hypothetical protein